jgi:NAD(P)H-dependent FMN reductase
MDTTLKIKVIVGSTRANRFSEKPAHFIFDEIKKVAGVDAELLDLRDYPLPFFNEAQSPMMLKGMYSDETAKKWSAKIQEADAFIVITPEYNHGAPAVLKNAFDWLSPEWAKKPIGFVSYGVVGGARSVEQLRLTAIELSMVPTRNAINISSDMYRTIVNEPTPVNPELFKSLMEPINRVEMLFNELIGLAKALKTLR